MESTEIIKNIDKIYSKYPVPKNLQEHMLKAANVGNSICKNMVEKEKRNN